MNDGEWMKDVKGGEKNETCERRETIWKEKI
jgi:hypothetical protein